MLYYYFRLVLLLMFLFFFKQKTAYEMRISDWSSDVCSSDLADVASGAALDAQKRIYVIGWSSYSYNGEVIKNGIVRLNSDGSIGTRRLMTPRPTCLTTSSDSTILGCAGESQEKIRSFQLLQLGNTACRENEGLEGLNWG